GRRRNGCTCETPVAAPSVVGFATARGGSNTGAGGAETELLAINVGATPGAVAPHASSARCTAPIVCGRSSGDFASILTIRSASGGDSVGTMLRGGVGGTST